MFSSKKRICLASLLICLVAPVQAETPSFWLRADAFSSTRQQDDRHGAGSLEFGSLYRADINDQQLINWEARAIAQGPDSEQLLRVQSAYWQYWNDSFTLRVGQQRLSFGRADGVNPTDYFTARDYQLLQPFEEDTRRSLAAVRWEQSLDEDFRIVGVVAPDFVPGLLPLPKSLDFTSTEPNAWRSPQFALKLDRISSDWEWSLSAFDGYQTIPLWSPAAASPIGYQQSFVPLRAMGLDGATTLGSFGFRWEMAWWDPRPDETQLPTPRQFFAVVGGDRGADVWNVNLQIIYRRTPDNLNPAFTRAEDMFWYRQNLRLLVQEKSETWGMSSRWWVANTTQTWRAELLLLHYFNPSNSSLRPQLSWEISDSTRLTIGGEYQLGPEDTPLGQLRTNNTFYFELKHFLP